MPSFSLSGREAALFWGYQQAASLGPWTVTADGSECSLSATVVSEDAFRVRQSPLTFRVSRQTGRWTWPILTLHIAGGALTARLGPQE